LKSIIPELLELESFEEGFGYGELEDDGFEASGEIAGYWEYEEFEGDEEEEGCEGYEDEEL
jgi:hypothetical protein